MIKASEAIVWIGSCIRKTTFICRAVPVRKAFQRVIRHAEYFYKDMMDAQGVCLALSTLHGNQYQSRNDVILNS